MLLRISAYICKLFWCAQKLPYQDFFSPIYIGYPMHVFVSIDYGQSHIYQTIALQILVKFVQDEV